jgi:hypothetical protein
VETEVKWCTYGAFGKGIPTFIGQLVEQQGNSGKIRYAEKQMYPLEYWDMDYVAVHESLEDAIIYMITHNSDESVLQIRDYLSFETGKRDVDWDELRKTELEIYNNKRNG